MGLSQVMNTEEYSSTISPDCCYCTGLEVCWETSATTKIGTMVSSQAEALWIQESQVSLTDDKSFQTLERQIGLFRDSMGTWR